MPDFVVLCLLGFLHSDIHGIHSDSLAPWTLGLRAGWGPWLPRGGGSFIGFFPGLSRRPGGGEERWGVWLGDAGWAPDRCVVPGDMGHSGPGRVGRPLPLHCPPTVLGTWGENVGPEALQRELPRTQKPPEAAL